MEIVKDDEWGLYPNFVKDEFVCRHTGICLMTHKLMRLIQDIRTLYGKPIIISSGYRDISHPDEKFKPSPGEHTMGMAADIKVWGEDALSLTGHAIMQGCGRIGLSQRGEYTERFIHLGVGDHAVNRFAVGIWTY